MGDKGSISTATGDCVCDVFVFVSTAAAADDDVDVVSFGVSNDVIPAAPSSRLLFPFLAARWAT